MKTVKFAGALFSLPDHLIASNGGRLADTDDCDLGISYMNSRKITPAELQAARLGWINFHPAPLPAYRGRNVFAHAILNCATTWRVTAHYMDEDFDTGPIIDTEDVAVQPDDTAFRLHMRAIDALLVLMQRVIPAALQASARLPARPQQGPGRYYDKHSLEGKDCLDHVPAADWDRVVRAFTFPNKPPAYLTRGGIRYAVTPWRETP